MSDGDDSTLLGRRDFLGRGTLLGLGVVGVGSGVIGARSLWPRTGLPGAPRLDAGRPDEYRVGEVDGRLLREGWVWVVRTPEGFYAVSARCTHLGCKLRHVDANQQFHCMCHGSLFGEDGDVLRGPAARPLERVFITLSVEGRLLVDPSVRYRRELGQWDSPGAFVRLTRGRERG